MPRNLLDRFQLRSLLLSCLALAAILGDPARAAAQTPINDLCVNAIPLQFDVEVIGDTLNATSDALVDACPNFGHYDIWYEFTAPADGEYRFISGWEPGDDRRFPQTLALYSSCGGSLVACDTAGFNGLIDLQMTANQNIKIRVAFVGFYFFNRLTIRVTSTPPGPFNDNCDTPTDLAHRTNYFESILNVFEARPSSASPSCGCGQRDLWYRFTAPRAGKYRLSVSPFLSDLDMVNRCYGPGISLGAAVFTDCTLTEELACDSVPLNPIGQDDGATRLQLNLEDAQTILIRIAHCNDFALHWDILIEDAPSAPANDQCSSPQTISQGDSLAGSTVGADGLFLTGLSCVPSAAFDVWYSFTNPNPESRVFTFNASSSEIDFYPLITAYSACNGNELGCGISSVIQPVASVFVPVNPGQTIILRVAGHGRDGGTNCDRSKEGTFTITADSGQTITPNDNCSQPLALVPGSTVFGSTFNATASPGTTTCYASGIDSVDVWFSLTNPETTPQSITISPFGPPDFTQQMFAIHDSCSSPPALCANSLILPLTVPFEPGQTRLIRVAGVNPERGPFDFVLSPFTPLPSPPVNDLCGGATPIDSMPYLGTLPGGVFAGRPDQDVPCNEDDQTHTEAGLWYSFTPATDGILRFRSVTGNQPLLCAVFSGTCSSLNHVACVRSENFPVYLTAGVPYTLLVAQADTPPSFPNTPDASFGLTFDQALIPGETCAAPVPISFPFNQTAVVLFNLQSDGLADAGLGACDLNPANFPNGLHQSGYLKFTATSLGVFQPEFIAPSTPFLATTYRQTSPANVCQDITEIDCLFNNNAGQVRLNPGQSCIIQIGLPSPSPTAIVDFRIGFLPLCPGEFDGDDAVTVADIFAFLNAWFSEFNNCSGNDCNADIDLNGVVAVADIFAFLNFWFSQFGRPCP